MKNMRYNNKKFFSAQFNVLTGGVLYSPLNLSIVNKTSIAYFSSKNTVDNPYADFLELDSTKEVLDTFEDSTNKMMKEKPELMKNLPFHFKKENIDDSTKIMIYVNACFISEFYRVPLKQALALISYFILYNRDVYIPGFIDEYKDIILNYMNNEKNMRIINTDNGQDSEIYNTQYDMYQINYDVLLNPTDEDRIIITEFDEREAEKRKLHHDYISTVYGIYHGMDLTKYERLSFANIPFTELTIERFSTLVKLYNIPRNKASFVAKYCESVGLNAPGCDDLQLLKEINNRELYWYKMSKVGKEITPLIKEFNSLIKNIK